MSMPLRERASTRRRPCACKRTESRAHAWGVGCESTSKRRMSAKKPPRSPKPVSPAADFPHLKHRARARGLKHMRARARGRLRRAPRMVNTHRLHAQAWMRGGGLRSGGAGTMRRDSRGPRASCVCVRGRGPGGRHHPPRSACARAQPRYGHSLPGIARGDAGERAPRPRQGVAHPPLSARHCLCGHHARRISVGDLLGLGGKQ